MKVVKRFDKKMCETFACPAIMQDENGDYLIIGTDVTDQVENLAEFEAGCAKNERIVSIPASVFEQALKGEKKCELNRE